MLLYKALVHKKHIVVGHSQVFLFQVERLSFTNVKNGSPVSSLGISLALPTCVQHSILGVVLLDGYGQEAGQGSFYQVDDSIKYPGFLLKKRLHISTKDGA